MRNKWTKKKSQRKKIRKKLKGKFLKLKFKLIFIAIITSLSYFLLKFSYQFLQIKNIVCSIDNNSPCPNEFIITLKKLEKKSLLTLDVEEEIENLKNNDLNYQDFNYYKLWPKTLFLNFHFSEIAYFLTNSEGTKIAFNSNGQQINYYQPKKNDLEIFFQNDIFSHKFQIKPFYNDLILAIIKGKQKNNLAIQILDLTKINDFMILIKNQDWCAIFNLSDWENKMIDYNFLVQNYSQSKLQNQEIDFRFKLIVLREKTELCK